MVPIAANVTAPNLYEAPKAPLRDVEPSGAAAVEKRPLLFVLALVVLWGLTLSTLLNVIPLAMWLYKSHPPSFPIFMGMVALLYFAIFLLLWRIGQGRNWARISFTILYGLIVVARSFFVILNVRNLNWGLFNIALAMTLQVGAVAALYLPSTNAWFRSRRALSRENPWVTR